MFVRVTQFEMDMVRASQREVLDHIKEMELPKLHHQPGYEGLWVLSTPEGKGVLITLWDTAESADAVVTTGIYDEQVAKLVTLLSSSPGRDHYEVVLSDTPVKA